MVNLIPNRVYLVEEAFNGNRMYFWVKKQMGIWVNGKNIRLNDRQHINICAFRMVEYSFELLPEPFTLEMLRENKPFKYEPNSR